MSRLREVAIGAAVLVGAVVFALAAVVLVGAFMPVQVP